MIEAIMFFALGFLGATLIALITLSAVWHRAVRLTTKRIEGAIPVSMVEIQADKDQLRAEFAMSTRRLENSVEQLKFKTSEQLAEIGRKSEAVRLLKNEVEAKTARATALEAQERTLRGKLNSTEEELSAQSRMLHDAEAALSAKEKEIAGAQRVIGSVTNESDSRQVEIVALQTQRDTLKSRIEMLEREISTTEQRMATERDAAERAKESLNLEHSTAEDLKARLREMETLFSNARHETEALVATIEEMKRESQHAAALANRREEELQTRLSSRERELGAHLAKREGELLAAAQQRESELQKQLSATGAKLSAATEDAARNRAEAQTLAEEAHAKTEAFQATIEILKSEKAQLEGALAQLREDRDRMAAEAASLRAQAEKSWAEERMESALLRERINDVAAEVARLAINLEGANSPIEQLLAADPQTNGHQNGTPPSSEEARVSLAQRIRNLQSRAR
jgi:chromosome segregation ATPase